MRISTLVFMSRKCQVDKKLTSDLLMNRFSELLILKPNYDSRKRFAYNTKCRVMDGLFFSIALFREINLD